MNVREVPIQFDCQGERLQGIVSQASADGADGAVQAQGTGVVVIVGGPQYRAGSHRQFVQLARAASTSGYVVLRFDVRGMGDSTGAIRSFEDITPDVGAAIDALLAHAPHLRRVVLWGLCDGASAALLYMQATADTRVAGMCLLNPWVRSATSQARTHVKHYYADRLMQRDFWTKLLTGRVAASALSGLWRNLLLSAQRPAGAGSAGPLRYQDRMALAWNNFDGAILLLLSGDDYTAKEFLEYVAADARWQGCLARPGLCRHDIAGADHTFSTATVRRAAELRFLEWLSKPQTTQRSAAAC